MFKRTLVLSSSVLALLAMITVAIAADKAAEFKATCPVSGKPAKKDAHAAHNGGQVYFCCNKCKAAFEKDSTKFAAKANAQLIATGQAKQVACPIAGRPVNAATAIEVAGVKVAFCCNGCKGKATKAKGDAQLTLVFSDKAFKKGFKVGDDK